MSIVSAKDKHIVMELLLVKIDILIPKATKLRVEWVRGINNSLIKIGSKKVETQYIQAEAYTDVMIKEKF